MPGCIWRPGNNQGPVEMAGQLESKNEHGIDASTAEGIA